MAIKPLELAERASGPLRLPPCRVALTPSWSFPGDDLVSQHSVGSRLQLLIGNLLIEHVHSDTFLWLLEIVDLVMAFIPHEKGKAPLDIASTHE